ncbi:CDP-diacylglycerol--serine O-phosphatidyltransferase [Candidatus Steffania adelgidicola]|uniref:CDP-diacylglycerol--serine O-phosphatidyltransferase n=1 Tax=Candidatus Steffania adelgidicola TaxID=1076626 RepID=UPI001D029902|nr:CDP-diacylglycerol--serine O-phosphatidyltransferase [Candidatus Steffania adelgidicola]UDG79530.1 CDP-diacylglycerol--serine O-phosphatidyltransferase [Candidatus Steffania adelgidicola]
MLLSNFKYKKHQQHLLQLPKIPQMLEDITILYSPVDFYQSLMQAIRGAQQRIYLVSLYLEQDQGGERVLKSLYAAKRKNPNLEIAILVDWHRAHRSRIGSNSDTNANWYCRMKQSHPGIDIPIYGVPVNTREALGVLHLKGFIIDTKVIYSGASLNNVYLHQKDQYRYDRYQIIHNPLLADTLLNYIKQYLLTSPAVNQLDNPARLKSRAIKKDTRLFRRTLREASYSYQGEASATQLAITPLVGLGKQNSLNKTIHHLLCSTRHTLILSTPYFNLPAPLMYDLIRLLSQGKQLEIIVGDKTTNDFYIPENKPFKIISTIPYLYEINLRYFVRRLQRYLDNGQLTVRLWQDHHNTYHLKGLWIDNEWQLLTGSNFNLRAWRLDLENALLIHDPNQELHHSCKEELTLIRTNTSIIKHFTELQRIAEYPVKVRKLIRRLRRIRIDRLISRIL